MRDPRSPSTPRSSSTDVPRPNGGTHRVEAAEYASAHWPGLVALGRSLGATDEQVRIAADAMVRKCPGLESVSEWEQTANNYVSTQVWIDNQPKDERSSVPARRRSTAGDVALEGKYADTLRMHKTNLERK